MMYILRFLVAYIWLATLFPLLPFVAFAAEVFDCSLQNVRCVDDTSGPTQEYSTIQSCAQAAVAGDICLVHPGNYPETVSSVNGGTAEKPIRYRALYTATSSDTPVSSRSQVKGFRLLDPYISIEGFDITKSALGSLWGHITVEPAGDHCNLQNNLIRDGIYLTSFNYYIDATTMSITNPSGGFLAAGFAPGSKIYLASNINEQILNHDTIKTVVSLTDTELKISDVKTAVANWQTRTEGPVNSTIYVTRSDKMGVTGIHFTLTSSNGAASDCTIRGNYIKNLAGSGLTISGVNHLVERNTWEAMNGWRMITLGSSDSTFRYNIFKDSPRWPGFPAPKPGNVPAPGTGTWDLYSAWLYSSPSTTNSIRNNIFEYNILKNIDNSGGQIEETLAGGVGHNLIFRNNVFVGVESAGAFHYSSTQFVHNTFFRSALNSGANIILEGNTAHGVPSDSIVKNNVFVANNKLPDKEGIYGWYNAPHEVLAEEANYNFVAGSVEEGYPPKKGFTGTEVNGISGGNPQFQNIADIIGADGLAFTADDGLQPLPGSPLCGAGAGGSDLGAYQCKSGMNFSPSTYLITPVPAEIFDATATIVLTASAIDRDGSILKVEFYNGEIKIGEALSAPYRFEWRTPGTGKLLLRSKAYDDKGSSSFSLPITVQIGEPSAVPRQPTNLRIAS